MFNKKQGLNISAIQAMFQEAENRLLEKLPVFQAESRSTVSAITSQSHAAIQTALRNNKKTS